MLKYILQRRKVRLLFENQNAFLKDPVAYVPTKKENLLLQKLDMCSTPQHGRKIRLLFENQNAFLKDPVTYVSTKKEN